MANNRLYILDTETNEKLLLAKSFGARWSIRVNEDVFNNWMIERDIGALTSDSAPSSLKLITD